MKRLTSIDATRGLVMLLMLVDHTRESFYLHAQVSDPVDVTSTDPSLFFTRITAHLCAPVFVALTGLGASLHFEKYNDLNKTRNFLLIRGFILILLEMTVISFGWGFAFPHPMLFLQVIWAIGLSMIALSFLIKLPLKILIGLGFAIVLGHNLLDFITFKEGEPGYAFWSIFHDRSIIHVSESFKIRTSYPVFPWIGVMALGYGLGAWFKKSFDPEKRYKLLWMSSTLSMTSFLILRTVNLYGDKPWSLYPNATQTIMSFLNLTKYPPSADFLLFTLSIGLAVMAVFEKSKGKISSILSDFGSVPMFYYIVHIYILNIINGTLKYILGPNQGTHFSVPSIIYLWVISFILAFPLWYLCRWYAKVKKAKPESLLKYI